MGENIFWKDLLSNKKAKLLCSLPQNTQCCPKVMAWVSQTNWHISFLWVHIFCLTWQFSVGNWLHLVLWLCVAVIESYNHSQKLMFATLTVSKYYLKLKQSGEMYKSLSGVLLLIATYFYLNQVPACFRLGAFSQFLTGSPDIPIRSGRLTRPFCASALTFGKQTK